MTTKFKLDGSETSWLIYADWLEDQGKDATLIRQSINELYEIYDPNELTAETLLADPQAVGSRFFGFNRSLVGSITNGSPNFFRLQVGTPAETCNAVAGSYFQSGKFVGIGYQTR